MNIYSCAIINGCTSGKDTVQATRPSVALKRFTDKVKLKKGQFITVAISRVG